MTHRYRIDPTSPTMRGLCAALLCALAACARLPAPPAAAPPAPKSPPAPPPAPAAAATAPSTPASTRVLQIDTGKSLIVATVRRGGVLARLGHDHVVASHTVTGTVEPAQNRADFQFRLDQMKVDEADLRREAGLETTPSADAIDGTRTNMLTKVLDAERYPVVTVHAERGEAGAPLRVAITLHGVTRGYAIPVALRDDGGVITVSGTVELKQTDFGLVPFSVMGGAMAVQDTLALRFTVIAK